MSNLQANARQGGKYTARIDALIRFIHSVHHRPLVIAWYISLHRDVGYICSELTTSLEAAGLQVEDRPNPDWLELQGGVRICFVTPAADDQFSRSVRVHGWITSRWRGEGVPENRPGAIGEEPKEIIPSNYTRRP